MMVTSNLSFSDWTQVFGDERLTAALLDRLTHRAHIMSFNIISTSLHLSSVELKASKRLRRFSFTIFSSFRQALQINISKILYYYKVKSQ